MPMCLDDNIIKINLHLYEKSFLNLDVNDVYTYEMHYKNTHAIVNKVEIKEYEIEEILIKFQKANLLRIDGIQNEDKAYREFSSDIDSFNGILLNIEKIQHILQKHLGKTFLRRLKLNVGIEKKFIYKTREESIYFKTYILLCNKQIFQIELVFYEEEDDYFCCHISPTQT